jgi:hypothetical protein
MNTPIINPAHRPGTSLSPATALRLAWLAYLLLLIVPFFVALRFVWHLGNLPRGGVELHVNGWFLASMILVAAALTGASFWRQRMFKDYRQGRVVPPRKYLAGMIGIWGSLTIAGLFSLASCIVTQTLLPNVIPALLGMGAYLCFWPTGRAMVRPVGATEDPQKYEEPR